MHGFRRRHGQLTCTFEGPELMIVSSLTKSLVQLLRSEAMPPTNSNSWPEPSDNPEAALFAQLAGELDYEIAADFATNPDIDPVLRRLFPDAYRDDPAAAAEFRRFSQCDERDEKLSAVVALLADINQVGQDGRCVVPEEHIDDWLKALTSLRLGLAVRLGIESAADADELAELTDDDPRSDVFSIYEWLGWVQESLLDCLQ